MRACTREVQQEGQSSTSARARMWRHAGDDLHHAGSNVCDASTTWNRRKSHWLDHSGCTARTTLPRNVSGICGVSGKCVAHCHFVNALSHLRQQRSSPETRQCLESEGGFWSVHSRCTLEKLRHPDARLQIRASRHRFLCDGYDEFDGSNVNNKDFLANQTM